MNRRCFVCGARMWARTNRNLVFASGGRRAFRFACGSCGVLTDDPAADAECRDHLNAKLGQPDFASDEDAPYGLDIHSLRTAATGAGLAARPADERQRQALLAPHGEVAAEARLLPLASKGEPCVSLGLPCRAVDLDAVLAAIPDHARWTSDIVVMVDGTGVPFPEFAGARIVARPLAGDFAEQRNALQATARLPWMLQLDADETLAPETAALLPAVARLADETGAVSVGLPRRNLVDGALSDVFPDVQYRLNRREVRYAGRVHERPERPWQRSFIALHGAIDHHLDRAHVLARSQRYEAMAPGRGRLEEGQALLRPYRD